MVDHFGHFFTFYSKNVKVQYTQLKNEVLSLLREKLSQDFSYHNVEHTQSMLEVAPEYAAYEGLQDHELELLMLAILFHDLGFISDWTAHVKKSAEMAGEAMTREGYSKEDVESVTDLIFATEMPQEPKNRLEKIICDVDLDYLGGDHYEERSELLFKEWLALGLIKDHNEWEEKEYQFLKHHRFHSAFGKKYRQPRLDQLIRQIESERA